MPVSASGLNDARCLERDAQLVLPVDAVRREGHEPQRARPRRHRAGHPLAQCRVEVGRPSEETGLERDRSLPIGKTPVFDSVMTMVAAVPPNPSSRRRA